MNYQEKPKRLVWKESQVRDFWDYQATIEENYFTNQFGKEISNVLWPYLRRSVKVLDLGCGAGFLIPYVAEKMGSDAVIAGADFSLKSIERTERRCRDLGNFIGATTVDRSEEMFGKFNSVLMIEVIEHLYDDHLEALLQKAISLLENGGSIIISTPNCENLEANTVHCPSCNVLFHRWQHVRSFTAETLVAHMEERGFRTTRVFTTNFCVSTGIQRLKVRIKSIFLKNNPHLVYIGKKVI